MQVLAMEMIKPNVNSITSRSAANLASESTNGLNRGTISKIPQQVPVELAALTEDRGGRRFRSKAGTMVFTPEGIGADERVMSGWADEMAYIQRQSLDATYRRQPTRVPTTKLPEAA
jgi:hypothetical protein